ncbi:methyltransferase [unidentified eubacterium SCB49]|nr:methyltransferase [unidentified eubacterium SCB49]
MQKETEKWYSSWFDSPYYHILYKDRDDSEAAHFMKNLTSYLKLPPKAEILDLACGRGRHSKTLHNLKYNVTGIDLSTSNIDFAKQYEEKGLTFKVHNMCIPLNKKFDAVFNLFTSFGYFENEKDNQTTINAIIKQLKPKANGVIDFLNIDFVKDNLVKDEIKIVNGISFNLKREIVDGYILKHINFKDNGQTYSFVEKVKALTKQDFLIYLTNAGAKNIEVFGDYHLNEYNKQNSERLILIFKR